MFANKATRLIDLQCFWYAVVIFVSFNDVYYVYIDETEYILLYENYSIGLQLLVCKYFTLIISYQASEIKLKFFIRNFT